MLIQIIVFCKLWLVMLLSNLSAGPAGRASSLLPFTHGRNRGYTAYPNQILNAVEAMPETLLSFLQAPKAALDATQMTEQELLRELALTLYTQNRLSLGKARELAGLSLWEFRQWLATRRIEAHYDTNDLQDDLAALRALDRLP